MRFELAWRPRRFELLHQVRGAHHLAALRADQLDGPGVHQRYVRDLILRRILHRHFLRTPDEFLQILFQLLSRCVDHLFAGQRVEGRRFDPVHQLSRRAFRRNHVEPAAFGHGVLEPEHAVGDSIAMEDVVEQPPVELLLAEGLLDGADVGHMVYFVDS